MRLLSVGKCCELSSERVAHRVSNVRKNVTDSIKVCEISACFCVFVS